MTTDLLNRFSDPDDYDLEALANTAVSERVDRHEHGLVELDGETVVTGDLVIEGDLELNGHLLVLGSLRCSGFVFTGIHCCLVVKGDVTARAVEALRSYWLVGGSITSETAWLSTYGFLMLGGELRTQLLVVQQYFELRDDPAIVARMRIDTDYLSKDLAAKARLDEVLLTSEMLDDDGDFDSWALLRKMSRGDRVFR